MPREKALNWLRARTTRIVAVMVDKGRAGEVCVGQLYKVLREKKPDIYFLESFVTHRISRITK